MTADYKFHHRTARTISVSFYTSYTSAPIRPEPLTITLTSDVTDEHFNLSLTLGEANKLAAALASHVARHTGEPTP